MPYPFVPREILTSENLNAALDMRMFASGEGIGFVPGALIFGHAANGGFQTDSANLTFDNVNDRLGIRTNAPQAMLHVGRVAGSARVYNSYIDPANGEWSYLGDWSKLPGAATYGTDKAGTGFARNLQILVGGSRELDYGISNPAQWTIPNADPATGRSLTVGSIRPMYVYASAFGFNYSWDGISAFHLGPGSANHFGGMYEFRADTGTHMWWITESAGNAGAVTQPNISMVLKRVGGLPILVLGDWAGFDGTQAGLRRWGTELQSVLTNGADYAEFRARAITAHGAVAVIGTAGQVNNAALDVDAAVSGGAIAKFGPYNPVYIFGMGIGFNTYNNGAMWVFGKGSIAGHYAGFHSLDLYSGTHYLASSWNSGAAGQEAGNVNTFAVNRIGMVSLGEGVQFTSAFPALKRNAATLEVSLADNTGWAYISAKTAPPATANNWLATTAFVTGVGDGASGFLPTAGGQMFGGINFGNMLAADANDTSRHITLWNTGYGFSITGGTLNYITGGQHHFIGTGASIAQLMAGGAFFNVPVIVQPTSTTAYPLDIIDLGTNAHSVLRIRNTPSGWGLAFDPFWPGVSFNSYHDGVSKKAFSNDYSGAFFLNPSNGTLTFSSGNNPGAGFTVSEIGRLSITATGFVGINHDNPIPAQSLAVRGAVWNIGATVRSYNTMLTPTNSEWAYMGDWSGNVARYGTDKTGTGLVRNIQFLIGGINQLDYGITTPSAWVSAAPLAVYGGFLNSSTMWFRLGSTVPLAMSGYGLYFNVHYGTDIVPGWRHVGTPSTYTGAYTFDTNTGQHYWHGSAPNDPGIAYHMTFKNGRLAIGDWVALTNQFAAIKGIGGAIPEMQIRLADDSGWATLRAGYGVFDCGVNPAALHFAGNANQVRPPIGFGGALAFNFSAGGAEVDFWNVYAGATRGFSFYQLLTSTTHRELMRLEVSGEAILYGPNATAAVGTSNSQLATTAFVRSNIDTTAALYLPLVGGTLSGSLTISVAGTSALNLTSPFNNQSVIYLSETPNIKWQIGKGTDNSLYVYDQVRAFYPLIATTAGALYTGSNFGIKTLTPQADLQISTSAGTARIYNAFTDAFNSEWAYLGSWSGNISRYGTDQNGSGSVRDVEFLRGGVVQMGLYNNSVSINAAGIYFHNPIFNHQSFTLNNAFAGYQTAITFSDVSVPKWQIGRQADNSFFIYDAINNASPMLASTAGMVSLGESQQIQIPKVGATTFNPGINFGTIAVATPGDLSRHIALYYPDMGFSITGYRLNYFVNALSNHVFVSGVGVDVLTVANTARVGIKNFTPQADLHVGTTAGTARVYNSYTDVNNGEWAYMGSWSANTARYGTDNNGTGAVRNVQILVGGVDRLNYGVSTQLYPDAWTMSSGRLIMGVANQLTIFPGGIAYNHYYNGNFIFTPGSFNQHAGTVDFDMATGSHRWWATTTPGNAGAVVGTLATMMVVKRNPTLGGPFLAFGDWVDYTAAFPALRRSGTSLELRLADDSNYAPFRAAAITGTTVTADTLGGLAMVYAQAQWTMSSAGTVTWSNSRLSWTSRFIWIPVSQIIWTQVEQPFADIPAAYCHDGLPRSVAGGVLLNGYEALYWDVSINQLRIVYYVTPFTPQSSWLLVGAVSDGGIKLGSGQYLTSGQSTSNGVQSQYIWNHSSWPQGANISIANSGWLRNYSTYVDANNNNWVSMGEMVSGIAYYGTGKLGSGAICDIQIVRGSVPYLYFKNGAIQLAPLLRYEIGDAIGYSALARTLFVRDQASELPQTAGGYLYPFEFVYQAGSYVRLNIAGYRRFAGAGWTGSGYRIQASVDSSFLDGTLAYVELGSNAAGAGRLHLSAGGYDSLSITAAAGYVGIKNTTPGVLLDVTVPPNQSDTIRISNTYLSGPGASVGATIESVGVRGDGNGSFDGRFGVGFRRTDGLPIDNGYIGRIGTFGFGGQWGTDQTYVAAKMLYPASIQGIVEGAFTAADNMPTGLSFRTGLVGQDIRQPNTSFGTERIRIAAGGNVGIGDFASGIGASVPKANLHVGGGMIPQATARVYWWQPSATDGEWAYMGSWSSANNGTVQYGSDKSGTGVAKPFQFLYGGVDVLNYGITNATAFTFGGTYPLVINTLAAGGYSRIGSPYAIQLRPGDNGVNAILRFGSDFNAVGIEAVDNGGVSFYRRLDLNGSSVSISGSPIILASNTIVAFGGTTSAYSALKRVGAELQVRTADDFGFANLHANSVYVNGDLFDRGTAPLGVAGSGYVRRRAPTFGDNSIADAAAFYIAGNTGMIPTAGGWGGAVNYNYSQGGAELSFWNLYPSAGISFSFRQVLSGGFLRRDLMHLMTDGSVSLPEGKLTIGISGTGPATLNVYKSARTYNYYFDSSNSEFAYLGTWIGDVAYYGTNKLGTGFVRDVAIYRGDVLQMYFASSGIQVGVPFSNHTGTIAQTAGAYTYPAWFGYNCGNAAVLQIAGYRRAANTSWHDTGFRLQSTVDGVFVDGGLSYVEITNVGGVGRVILGGTSGDWLTVGPSVFTAVSQIESTGGISGFAFKDRDNNNVPWSWYAAGGITRLWQGVDRFWITSGGKVYIGMVGAASGFNLNLSVMGGGATYNIYTDTTNYELGWMGLWFGNGLYYGSSKSGTGLARDVYIQHGGINFLASNGAVLAIGANGSPAAFDAATPALRRSGAGLEFVTANQGAYAAIYAGSLWLQSPLTIPYGGTGATTAAGALTNLGAFPAAGGTITGNLTVNGVLSVGGAPPGTMAVASVNARIFYNTDSSAFANNAYIDSGGAWRYRATGAATVLNNDSGGYTFYTAASGTAGAVPTWTGKFSISNVGNLWSAGTYLYMASGGGSVNGVGGPFIFMDANNSVMHLGTGNQAFIVQDTAGTGRHSFVSDGQVSHNMTSGGLMDLNGSTGGDIAYGLRAGTSGNWKIYLQASTGNLWFYNQKTGALPMYITQLAEAVHQGPVYATGAIVSSSTALTLNSAAGLWPAGAGYAGYMGIFNSAGTRLFYIGYDNIYPALQIDSGGEFRIKGGNLVVTAGAISASSSIITGYGLWFNDRTTAAKQYQWYSESNIARLWTSVAGDALSVRHDNGWIRLGAGTAAAHTVEVYRPTTSDPLMITVDNGYWARLRFHVGGTRIWSAGCMYNGNFGIFDESGSAGWLDITPTTGLVYCGGGITSGTHINAPSHYSNGILAMNMNTSHQQLYRPNGAVALYLSNDSGTTNYYRSENHFFGNWDGSVSLFTVTTQGANPGTQINYGHLYMLGGSSVVENNNVPYCGRDTAGTIHNILNLAADNSVYVAQSTHHIKLWGVAWTNAHITPNTNNAQYCGGGSYNCWYAVSAYNFPNCSDLREKKDIRNLPDRCLDLVKSIVPKRFRWNHGLDQEREHWGFIAQEVAETMDKADLDFGGHQIHGDEKRSQALAYNELVALLWRSVQELTERLQILEAKGTA